MARNRPAFACRRRSYGFLLNIVLRMGIGMPILHKGYCIMINISKLYCGQITPGDWLRYGKKGSERQGESVPAKASQRRPIVVWNITRTCNLKCVHCYNDSGADKACDELSTAQAKAVIDNLAAFGVPSVLFSGGEPLMRPDLFELIEYTVGRGLRAVISTNGTLISADVARNIQRLEIGRAHV